MKKIVFITALCFFLILTRSKVSAKLIDEKRQQLFNSEWRFTKDSLINAHSPFYDDSGWRILDLPHDWSIEDLPEQFPDSIVGPFSKASEGGSPMGYSVGGTGWYRKHFVLEKQEQGKLLKIVFDGVMQESDVWINGHHLGNNVNGYTPFGYDLTPYLNPAGLDNVLAVRVKNIGQSSRWYTGAGIYRNVSLLVTNPLHVDLWGVDITFPKVTKEQAVLNLKVNVVNATPKDAKLKIKIKIQDKDGCIHGQSEKLEEIVGEGLLESNQSVTINNPHLWSANFPNLYDVIIELISNGKLGDTYTMKTGIRSIEWDAKKGLQINGNTVKLRGGNVHHDNGLLGAAAFDRAEIRKVEILKANGFNAIRCSHNPPSTKFLEACDSIGMYVMNEIFDVWEKAKVPDDYHKYFNNYWKQDLKSMLLRDRNHPSVIIWSIGNEIEERGDSLGLEIERQIIREIRKLDTYRPITEAVNSWGYTIPWDRSSPIFKDLDIAGYNYNWQEWKEDHEKYPDRVVMTTESLPVEMGVIWMATEKYPWAIGDFVWTAMDYLGEAGVGTTGLDNETNYKVKFGNYVMFRTWPWFNAWCGDIDINGNKKAQSFYRDVVWDRSQMEIAVRNPVPEGQKVLMSLWGWPNEIGSWTWPGEDGKEMDVVVYSKCTSVRLELNGKVVGEKKVRIDPLDSIKPINNTFTMVPATQYTANFAVNYESGELKAVGLKDGKEVVTKVLKTNGNPHRIVLTPERSVIGNDRNDLAYIKVEVTDKNGEIIPNSDMQIEFEIKGDGELLAAGNAHPYQMESFQDSKCSLYKGKALVIVRPRNKTDRIVVIAKGKDVEPASVEIQVMN